MEEVQN